MRLSSAVLVGGQSRRMGRDKAALPAPPHRTLLERQLAILAALAPCERIISARAGQHLPRRSGRAGITIARDDGAAGPLGGLLATLRIARAPRTLLLGVDVARIDAGMLARVIGAAPEEDDSIGVIPRTTAAVQPLAALWPRSMLPLAEAQLAAGATFALRALVDRGVAAGLLRWFDVPTWDEWRFANWNHPADLPPSRPPPKPSVT